MGLFDSESRQHKNNLIALQNIVLEINEKKLQVSEEFLEKMTKIYISKYLKIINENVSTITKVTNVALLFRKYDAVMAAIEPLIAIEGYHRFSHPTPTEYKNTVEGNLDSYLQSLIGREWRKVSPQTNSSLTEVEQRSKCRNFFSTFDAYRDRMTEGSLSLLLQLRQSVFPEEFAPEPDSAQDGTCDGFVPETFETIGNSESAN